MSQPQSACPKGRLIVMYGYADVQILDVVGPMEVFAQANRFMAEAGRGNDWRYHVELVSLDGGMIRSSGGLSVMADAAIAQRENGIDTLLVSGGAGVHAAAKDDAALAWLRRQAAGVRRIGSVCTGTFLLAAAGVLDGRRVTTHWRSSDILAAKYPTLSLEADAIWVKDGSLYSSAGVTAGIDLALALVEEDCGPDVTLEIARNMVLYLRRSGGQSQYSAHLLGQSARTPAVKALQGWIMDHLHEALSVPDLAERAAMSPRNFARVFAAEIGLPPGRFIERARVDAARRALTGGFSMGQVIGMTGFGSTDSMRRAFLRQLGVTPSDYREHFAAE
ncbi:MAG TPA: DJ-1/PfpI family protein [Candidatus Sulfotelmatobacter sp.]|nr:DJ-1/PfpI family protein [Candidatus Sulfotelmatobacter sp.]